MPLWTGIKHVFDVHIRLRTVIIFPSIAVHNSRKINDDCVHMAGCERAACRASRAMLRACRAMPRLKAGMAVPSMSTKNLTRNYGKTSIL